MARLEDRDLVIIINLKLVEIERRIQVTLFKVMRNSC
jgi:hypothetical protein